MARTASEIQQHLENRHYPCGILSADAFNDVLKAALRDFQHTAPLTSLASFLTVNETQDYYIFDPAGAVAVDGVALCPNALSIQNVYWNPGGEWSALNIFSPGWHLITAQLLFSGSYLHYPSQMTFLRQKLNSWQDQFGSQPWDIVGKVGSPTAFLRLSPMPLSDSTTVVVEFTKAFGLEDISDSDEQDFEMYVEYYFAESMANYYSQSAGIELLGFIDSKSALTYWNNKAIRLWDRITSTQLGSQGAVERS